MNQGRPNWNLSGPRYRMGLTSLPHGLVRRPGLPVVPWQATQPVGLPGARSIPPIQSPLLPNMMRHPGPRPLFPRGPRPLMSIPPTSVEESYWQGSKQRISDDSYQGWPRPLQPLPPVAAPQQCPYPPPNDFPMVGTDCYQGRPHLMATPRSHICEPHLSRLSSHQASPRPLLETPSHLEHPHQERIHHELYSQPDEIFHQDNRSLGYGGRQLASLNYQTSSVQALPPQPPLPEPPPPPLPLPKIETVTVEELFDEPGRSNRPAQFVIILRGPPGTGKSHVAKLLKDKEGQHNGVSIRILSLDDYFLMDVDSVSVDPETGKKSKKKSIEYCYDAEMEQLYKDSLFKSFCKTLDDPDFPIIIIDCINHKLTDFEKFWSQAKVKGFEVFIAELMSDINDCVAQSSHGRSRDDIAKIIREWQHAPSHYKRLDVRSLHQAVVINEVEMEIGENAYAQLPKDNLSNLEDVVKSSSRWEAVSDDRLDALDGVRKSLKRKRESDSTASGNIEDFLHSLREADTSTSITGAEKKRVHWADIENKKQQERQRKIGFIIGQDWSHLTPDSAVVDKLLTGNDQ